MTEKELQKIFSSNIKRYRNSFHWTQMQLSKKAGVTVNFINDLEAGKKWASVATMIKLADAFGIQAYELLKPPGIFPDNLDSILRKYNDDIIAAMEKTRDTFIQDEAACGK